MLGTYLLQPFTYYGSTEQGTECISAILTQPRDTQSRNEAKADSLT